MQLHVGSGIGTGPTTMAAFDSALDEIGISNYNLIYLSSVAPPGSDIILHNGKIPFAMPGTWGDRMYVVMAQMRVDKHNVEAWAGVGWVQDKKTGKGLFTEHEGNSEAFVRNEITQSLEAFIQTRSSDTEAEWSPVQMVVAGRTCTDKPICAMAAVVYQISDWDNEPYLLEGKPVKAVKTRFWRRAKG